MYDFLTNSDYQLIFKPTVKQKGEVKGNVDAELVLHSKRYSSLLREFNKGGYVTCVDLMRDSLEQKKDWHSRSVETLG